MDSGSVLNVVTGAFGYIGRYIARDLLNRGQRVRTITTHPDKPNPFGDRVRAFHYDFDDPERLVNHLSGAKRLFNTYYVRFERKGATFDRAVENTRILFDCARRAGIEKIVHIGVTQADPQDELPYYRGKALQDQALRDSGVGYAIVRPTLVFGIEDILVNNIAWLIRRFPIFPIFGSGQYRLQPIFVGDLAGIALEAAGMDGDQELDAVGPEEYTFEGFVRQMAGHMSPETLMFNLPPRLGVALGHPIGWLVGDVVLTWQELQGLMREKLTSPQAPNGVTAFSQWLLENHQHLGMEYTSELDRHFY